MIKEFMRVAFPKIIDLLFIVSLVCVFLAAFSISQIYGRTNWAVALPIMGIGFTTTVLVFGLIYTIIDIRDLCLAKKKDGIE